MRYSPENAREMALRAAIGAGANLAVAISLADATLAAELAGRSAVGFRHLPDYFDGFVSGRISGTAEPHIERPVPAVIRIDARGGIAQLGYDRAFDDLRTCAATYGVAILAQHNSYTAGELGYYTRRLAHAGLVAFAASNGPALTAAGASREAVFGTNPLSFGAPLAGGPPLVIDQASSATAFVNIRRAAETGEAIPEGWALDKDGAPTTDAREAVKGALLAFGGPRGANIALMVEVLAAGLSGANWSLDAPSFADGCRSPGAGLFVLALDPRLFAPDFADRLAAQAERLAAKGVHIPGRRGLSDGIDLSPSLVATIEKYARDAL